MRSYSSINEIFTYYSHTRDPGQATEAVAELWNHKVEELDKLPEPQRSHKIDKLLHMADGEPSPRFGELVRALASGAATPSVPDAQGVLHRPQLPDVLTRETPLDSLERFIDAIGRIINNMINPLVDAGLEPAIATRMRQRMSRAMMKHNYRKDFANTIRYLIDDRKVDIPCLWNAAEWLYLQERFPDTEHIVEMLAAYAQQWVQQNADKVPVALDRRKEIALAPARALLRLLMATAVEAFPVFEDHPGLEDALSSYLNDAVPKIDGGLAALRKAVKLARVFDQYRTQGEDALNNARWNDPEERATTLAYCVLSKLFEDWQKELTPQMQRIASEEAVAYWSHRIDKNPNNVDALLSRAAIWQAQSKLDLALKDLDCLVQAQDSAAHRLARSILFVNLGRFDEAEADLSCALKTAALDEPGRVRLYALRAAVRRQLNQPLQGWSDAVHALMAAPHDPQVHLAHETATVAEQAWWRGVLKRLDTGHPEFGNIVKGHEAMKVGDWAAAVRDLASCKEVDPAVAACQDVAQALQKAEAGWAAGATLCSNVGAVLMSSKPELGRLRPIAEDEPFPPSVSAPTPTAASEVQPQG